jgi:selenocysteine-specific elongation factor
MPFTVGTAGHIDHGKTWLVRALTGKDTDRLPEEQARGISIELGYAPLDLPDGRRLSLVDVPGHERFVRTMVAGASGIDLFLLVIDALEGARAQTHEHLAILRLLGIENGVVAVTKADAVDAETLDLALAEARELVPQADAVPVSAKSGAGLDELRSALARATEQVAQSHKVGPTRLYVDRSFTLRGVGTVATGTLWSGSIGAGDRLRVEPSGLDVRIRSVQVHDCDVERAEAGQRVAVNLPGVERSDLRRGDALVEPGAYVTSYRLDVVLEPVENIPDAVTVHHGTAQIPARVVRADARHAQLRLAAPVVAAHGDRFVVRTHTTVGGGSVIDPVPSRRLDLARMTSIERGDAQALVHEPVPVAELERRGLAPDGLERADGWVFSREWLNDLRDELCTRIDEADPLDPGVPSPSEPWADAVQPLLGLERRGAKLYSAGATATLGSRAAEAEELERRLAESGLEPVRVPDQALARVLEQQGRLVRVGDSFAVDRVAYARARDRVVDECTRAGSITLARFRDLLGISRRPAQLLLERLDADGITRRAGDERVLRRRGHLKQARKTQR